MNTEQEIIIDRRMQIILQANLIQGGMTRHEALYFGYCIERYAKRERVFGDVKLSCPKALSIRRAALKIVRQYRKAVA